MRQQPTVIGVDTGGSFTDLVMVHDGQVFTHKTPSTPSDFSAGVLHGIDELLGCLPATTSIKFDLVHSTTVATNTLLERTGAKTGLITTRGFRDVLEIGRQHRGELYNLHWQRQPPLVPRSRRLELHERVHADGTVERKPTSKDIAELLDRLVKQGVESIAVSLLFSFLHPDHEQAIAKAARKKRLPVYLSSEVSPEFREFERTSTTVANAFVSPRIKTYVHALSKQATCRGASHIRIVQSNGGSLSVQAAAEQGVRTLLSGPAAGLQGALALARNCLAYFNHNPDKLMTFDMGGTSTDVSLLDGRPTLTHEANVAGVPIRTAMLDVHTVGAGGGSIAFVDAGGLLHVGPMSAGADPGPACYGKGTLPTVTDANVIAGRLPVDYFLGGHMNLLVDQSLFALGRLADEMSITTEQAAYDVLRIVNATMERALRVISVERGYDPRDFTLVAYGGAGGLHACDVADALGIRRVLLPVNPGVVSAWGCVSSNLIKDYARTVMKPFDPTHESMWKDILLDLAQRARRDLQDEGVPDSCIEVEASFDLRYPGQSFELTVPYHGVRVDTARAFHNLHHQRYGHNNKKITLELVTLRTRGTGRLPRPNLQRRPNKTQLSIDNQSFGSFALIDRDSIQPETDLTGPVLVVESYSTLCITQGWRARQDLYGNLLLDKT